MRETTIARNYAEALFATGERTGDSEKYADLIEALAGAIRRDDSIRIALASPRVPKSVKQDVLSRALQKWAPPEFIRFLAAVIKRGRQGLFAVMSDEYLLLMDAKFNRVHAGVALAREPNEKLQREIVKLLSRALGKEVIPHYHVEPAILGGVIVKAGDRTMDGSLRRKIKRLRKRMLAG